jgi:hypothetical protein
MPILSSLGALTYSKDDLYPVGWFLVDSANLIDDNVQTAFDFANNKAYFSGVNIFDNVDRIPPSNGTNREASYGLIQFDSASSNIYAFNNNLSSSSVTQDICNLAGDILIRYTLTGSGTSMIQRDFKIESNGSHTTYVYQSSLGYAQLINQLGTTVNWNDTFYDSANTFYLKAAGSTNTFDNFSNGNHVLSGDGNGTTGIILEIAAGGASVISEFEISKGVDHLIVDQSTNDIYFVADGGGNSTLIKMSSSGIIAWQKQFPNSVGSVGGLSVSSITLTNDDVILFGQIANNPVNLSTIPIGIVSVQKSTGTINWVNKFNGTGFVLNGSLGKITTDFFNIYVTAPEAVTNKGFILKVPLNGRIPGTGSYSGGYTYETVSYFNFTTGTETVTSTNAYSILAGSAISIASSTPINGSSTMTNTVTTLI